MSNGRVVVAVTGDVAADHAAQLWATSRARRTGVEVATTRWADPLVDPRLSDAVLVVVGHNRSAPGAAATADAVLHAVDRVARPVVTVASAPPHPLTSELAELPRRPVVVGVPHDAEYRAVLDVAAREAVAAGTDLVVVRVWRDCDWAPSMTLTDAAHLAEWRAADGARLDAATTHVHHAHPELDVRCELHAGSVYRWLAEAGAGAELLVLGAGSGGRSDLTRWALLNVDVPVVVVPSTAAANTVAMNTGSREFVAG